MFPYTTSDFARPTGYLNQQPFQHPPPQQTSHEYNRWLGSSGDYRDYEAAPQDVFMGHTSPSDLSHIFNANNKYNATWVFLDLECTQLEPTANNFGILEIAASVVDDSLRIVDEFHVIIHQPRYIINASSKWCKERFTTRQEDGNELFAQCDASIITEEQAGRMLEQFIQKHAKKRKSAVMDPIQQMRLDLDKGRDDTATERGAAARQYNGSGGNEYYRVMLCGCSVYFDRSVLFTKYPYLKHLISHKTIELSSLLELSRRWRPDLLKSLPPSGETHRAKIDMLESVSLLTWFFRSFIVGQRC